MTKEEAITELNTFKIGAKSELGENVLDMAIAALEQEPCTVTGFADRCMECGKILGDMIKDAVSRKEVMNMLHNHAFDYATNTKISALIKTMRGEVDRMSSVTPAEKVGHWEQFGNSWEDKFKCSECGKEQPKILCGERIIGHWSDYCPNCGAKMQEVDG